MACLIIYAIYAIIAPLFIDAIVYAATCAIIFHDAALADVIRYYHAAT